MGGLLGLVFPMCECGIIPIMRRLLREGGAAQLLHLLSTGRADHQRRRHAQHRGRLSRHGKR